MKEENSSSSVLGWIDAVILVGSAVAALGYATAKTPAWFWLSAWLVQAAAFAVAVAKGRTGVHWPSTLFGAIQLAYLFALVVLLSSKGVSFDGLAQMFFGLLFVHGLLYFITAKPCLVRRGYLKPKKTQPIVTANVGKPAWPG